MTDLVIARLDTARTALAEASTASQVKTLMDAAEAARVYAKRQNLSEDTILYATEIRLDAERKLGSILANAPKNQGTLSRGTKLEPRDETPTLAELGINRKTSSRAQKLAKLPEETFEAVRSGELKVSDALRSQRQAALKAARPEDDLPPAPDLGCRRTPSSSPSEKPEASVADAIGAVLTAMRAGESSHTVHDVATAAMRVLKRRRMGTAPETLADCLRKLLEAIAAGTK